MLQKKIDPQFPQMTFALDMTLVREILQEKLFAHPHNRGGRFVIESCKLGEQRYKPGKSCVLSYCLQILNTDNKTVREQILYARLCKVGEGLSSFERARQKEQFDLEGILPIIFLSDLEIVIWTFPNDRKLTHLPKMFDLSFLHNLLPKRLAALDLLQSKHLKTIKADVVHYLPERSCMVRYELGIENRKSGEVSPRIIFGKIYPDESSGNVYRIMTSLSSQIEGMRVAKPLGYDPEIKVLWQSELPGRPFEKEEINKDCGKIMAQVAVTLARFHSSNLKSQTQFKFEDIKPLLKETSALVDKTYPQLSNRVRLLVQTLLIQSENVELLTTPITPIHGDLKIGNMLIDKGKVGLIDMDCVCLGDPLHDLGSFIANFYYNGIRVESDEKRVRWLVEEFCRVYSKQVEWEVSDARLHWHISAAFIYEIVRRSIRQWNVRRLKHINQYLDLSERYCFQSR